MSANHSNTGTDRAARNGGRGRDPDPEDPGKPDSPVQLTKPSWKYIARKTVREFSDDQCTDLAAALTYYAVLALFPGIIAVVSLVGLFGQAQSSVDAVMNMLKPMMAPSTLNAIKPAVENLATSQGAGLG